MTKRQVDAFLNEETLTADEDFDSEDEPPTKKPKATPTADKSACEAGTCSCREPVERRPWEAPDPPDGALYFDTKVEYHEDFDIVAHTEKYYNTTDYPALVVKHVHGKQERDHWHIFAVSTWNLKGKNKPWRNDERPWDPDVCKTPIFAAAHPRTPTRGFQYLVKPAECTDRCPVTRMWNITESDMYQIMEQSKENNVSFAENYQAHLQKSLLVHADPAEAYGELSISAMRYYHDQGRKLNAGIVWSVRDIFARHHPGGYQYIRDRCF